MTEYSLSVVLLIPSIHRNSINELAEAMGWGPNNMSRELVDDKGGVWYGCHTRAAPSFMNEFANTPEEYAEALAALIVSAIEGGNPSEHWEQVLADNGLSTVEAEE